MTAEAVLSAARQPSTDKSAMHTAGLAGNVNPVLVEVTNGDFIDSMHRGAAVVASADGSVRRQWGNIDDSFFPHSALKLLQALPLLESGAAAHFGLMDEEIVLSASSHVGDQTHVQFLAGWLNKCGIDISALKCGSMQIPFSSDAALHLRTIGAKPSSLHNNNAGKHLGFLTTALHFGEPLGTYLEPDHSVQHRVRAVFKDLTGEELRTSPHSLERCNMPAYATSLRSLATAMARFADPLRLPPERCRAIETLVAAVHRRPEFLVGIGRLSSAICAESPKLVVKGGHEGTFVGSLMGRGIGFALKIDDGAQRAADVTLLALLSEIGELRQDSALAQRLRPILRTFSGNPLGRLTSTLLRNTADLQM